MAEAVPVSLTAAVDPVATPRRRWLGRRDVVLLLTWLVIQVLINLAIYPFLPQYADPALNKLAWQLRAVTRQYEERRVASRPTAVSTAGVSQTSTSAWTLPYRLLRPDARGTEHFPLLVFLHGAGNRGHDNLQQIPTLPVQMVQPDWRTRFPCFVAAPQCPSNTSWSEPEVSDGVIAMIDELLREFPAIDRRRIYLTGLSMGGHGSWHLASRRPDLFAAVVPICGGGDSQDAPKLIHTPLWAVHGDADTVVPVSASREMIAAVRQAGGQPHYTELKDVGHDAWSQTYDKPDGVLKWVFSQKKPRPAFIHPANHD